jgi:pimeloyl-ACP methyl ester carboxylesterase
MASCSGAERSRWHVALACAMLVLLGGCVRDVKVYDADPAETFRLQQRSRLSSSELSRSTRDALTQLDLDALSRRDPLSAAEHLSTLAVGQPDAPWRLAAAEMLLDQAEVSADASLYLASAMQADLELQRALVHGGGLLDARTNFAAGIYRRAVTRFVATSTQQWLRDGSSEIVQGAGGRFVVSPAPDAGLLRFGPGVFDHLLPADLMRIDGMRNHHRLDAYGAPVVAIREQQRADPPRSEPLIPPEGLMTAATVTLRFDWHDRVAVEVWNPDHARTIEHHGTTLRLSTDVTAPIAELFARAELVSKGYRGLTKVQDYLSRLGIYLHEPYDPTKIPVLMVHGLRSSPATWRDLLNGLRNDPDVRERYQFWMFYYPTGLPVARSASYLRRALGEARAVLDPDGSNEPLRQMVVLGHSMGGLLTKAVLQDGGERFWASLHPEPFDTVAMPSDVRDHLREVFFYEADEGIARVVFMGVPHRGSRIASNWLGRLGDALIRLPDEFDSIDAWFEGERDRLSPGRQFQLGRGVPSSIDDLQSDSPHLLAYLNTPMRAGVPYHLIAGDQGNGSDGVVTVESAVVEGAESLLVIDSNHDVHMHPLAIREVRRVLLLHLEGLAGNRALDDGPVVRACGPGSSTTDRRGRWGLGRCRSVVWRILSERMLRKCRAGRVPAARPLQGVRVR